jgi:phage tail-like protein
VFNFERGKPMTIGASQRYNQKWRFKVVVDGFPVEAFFQRAGPLEAEVGVPEYHGGGAIIPHKEAGKGKFAPITLERGSTDDEFMYKWFIDVLNAASNAGKEQAGYKRNLTIFELDREGKSVKAHSVKDAFVKKYTAGDWDGTSEEFTMNIVELEYDYFTSELLV